MTLRSNKLTNTTISFIILGFALIFSAFFSSNSALAQSVATSTDPQTNANAPTNKTPDRMEMQTTARQFIKNVDNTQTSTATNTTNSNAANSVSNPSTNTNTTKLSEATVSTPTNTENSTVRSGGWSIFVLLAIPICLSLAYQYQYIRNRSNQLQTEEKKL
jgi:hypothetical protein